MGILVFVIILAVIIVAHELGHFVTARRSGIKVLEFGIGYPPRVWSFKRGETEYSINLLPLGGFVRLLGEEDPADPGSLAAQPKRTRLLVLASGALTNAFLPVLAFTLAFLIPQQVQVGGEGVRIASVAAESPAEGAGIRQGDVVVAADSQAVKTFDDLLQAVSASPGKEMSLRVDRPSVGTVEIRVTPRAQPPPGQGALGVQLTYVTPFYESRSSPPWEAVPNGFRATGRLFVAMFDSIGAMIGGEEPATVIGVVGMAQATTEVARGGIHDVLVWAAIISLSLAIMNLLPIPMLDGGRIALVGLEAVRGKRLSPQREKLVHFIGLVFLLSLMVAITYLDVLRIFRGENILP